jgi:hypothetical protein
VERPIIPLPRITVSGILIALTMGQGKEKESMDVLEGIGSRNVNNAPWRGRRGVHHFIVDA